MVADPAMVDAAADGPSAPPVLHCDEVVQEFKVARRGTLRRATVHAVSGVSLSIARGETYAIVGETGSGKSTLARSIIGAPPPRSGRILVSGRDMTGSGHSVVRSRGRMVSMVFQEPQSALDPTWTVERLLSEPINGRSMSRLARRQRIAQMLEVVGLDAARFAGRRPAELSGGQAQRVAIARALIASPELVICDEPVTALDVSVQAQIIGLLANLKRDLSLTYLLIAHDLAVVRVLADRVATMYLGKICETATAERLFSTPAHPYTAALLSAIPSRDRSETSARIRLLGEPPSPLSPPSGCRFRTRCPQAKEVCAAVEPTLTPVAPGQEVACHFPLVPAVAETDDAATGDSGVVA